ncbi:MAG: hemerythrin domain-containing protein [Pseudomonadaceae bacterium]|nr:hemerythrin domain-containing protein [Pseudomonadaceae bacterium]
MSDASPFLMTQLRRDHRRIGRVLQLLDAQIDALDSAGVDGIVLRDIVEYLAGYPEAVHHRLEDELFDRLVNSGLKPSEWALVSRNMSEHSEIYVRTQKLAEDIDLILRDVVLPVERLREDLLAYSDLQHGHMNREEQQLFPMALRLLTDETWRELETQARDMSDPMFDGTVERFNDLFELVLAATPE